MWGFSPQPWSPTLLSVLPSLPPEVSVPPRGLPSLLLTDGLVLGVCGWAGAEEEMLCQGEKVGVLWAGGCGGVGVGVTCSAGPCPRALGLQPLWEVGNQP